VRHISQRCGFKPNDKTQKPSMGKDPQSSRAAIGHPERPIRYCKLRSCARSSATIVAAALRASSDRSGGNEIAPTRAWPPPP
jgi:hypothetical protein